MARFDMQLKNKWPVLFCYFIMFRRSILACLLLRLQKRMPLRQISHALIHGMNSMRGSILIHCHTFNSIVFWSSSSSKAMTFHSTSPWLQDSHMLKLHLWQPHMTEPTTMAIWQVSQIRLSEVAMDPRKVWPTRQGDEINFMPQLCPLWVIVSIPSRLLKGKILVSLEDLAPILKRGHLRRPVFGFSASCSHSCEATPGIQEARLGWAFRPSITPNAQQCGRAELAASARQGVGNCGSCSKLRASLNFNLADGSLTRNPATT